LFSGTLRQAPPAYEKKETCAVFSITSLRFPVARRDLYATLCSIQFAHLQQLYYDSLFAFYKEKLKFNIAQQFIAQLRTVVNTHFCLSVSSYEDTAEADARQVQRHESGWQGQKESRGWKSRKLNQDIPNHSFKGIALPI
jgi:hypothetical protein